MTLGYSCIFVAYLLIWLPRMAVARAQAARPEGYDNNHPREQQAALVGWGKRAQAAHNNTFESFAPFAAAVIVAHLAHANQRHIDLLAMVYCGARLVYPVFYMANLGAGRSLVWLVGAAANVGLFVLPWVSKAP